MNSLSMKGFLLSLSLLDDTYLILFGSTLATIVLVALVIILIIVVKTRNPKQGQAKKAGTKITLLIPEWGVSFDLLSSAYYNR